MWLYVSDSAISLASNCVPAGDLIFLLRTACLFSNGKKRLYYYLIKIVNITILSLNVVSKTTQLLFKLSFLSLVFSINVQDLLKQTEELFSSPKLIKQYLIVPLYVLFPQYT